MVVVFGNVTNHTTEWRSSPNVRGSWDILSSCVITISLCAWTALHLNVPEHGTAGRQWLRKTKWLGLGLAAPEMVVYVAWRQRQEAKRLLRDAKKRLRQPSKSSRLYGILNKLLVSSTGLVAAGCEEVSTASSPASLSAGSWLAFPEWTLVHGFYAAMGGFAFDSSDASEAFLPDGRTRASLTTSGVRFLLEHEPDLLPDISEEQIHDKSKADGLKKFLVCVQAMWFCASSISRLISSLPISLLELNAMGHSACALLIYVMWWEKPLDVAEPTLIQGFQAHPLLAYMWMSSRVGAKGLKSQDLHGQLRDEFDAFWMYQNPKFDDLIAKDCQAYSNSLELDEYQYSPSRGERDDMRAALDKSDLERALYPRYFRHYKSGSPLALRYRIITWLRSKKYLAQLGIRFPAGVGLRRTAIEHVSPSDVVRWKLAHSAIRKYHLHEDVCCRHQDRSFVYDEDSRVKKEVGNFVSLFGSRPLEVWSGFAVAGLLYGGLHLLAWNASFPSTFELIAWRVAASSVTITPISLAPIALVFSNGALKQGSEDLMKMAQGRETDRVDGSGTFWFRAVSVALILPLFAIAPLLWFLYVLGRVYLVVECFKNIVYLPPGVFDNVSWSAYLPHIM